MNPYPGWLGVLFTWGQYLAPVWMIGLFVLAERGHKPKRCPKHTEQREIIFRARGVFTRF